MIQPYNYSSKFIERCERFMGSVEKLLARLESNEYAEKDPAFKDKIRRLVEMKEAVDSGQYSKEQEGRMIEHIKDGAEEIYGKRFGKVLGEKDITKEEKDKLFAQAREPKGRYEYDMGENIYDNKEIVRDYITDNNGMFKGIGLAEEGAYTSENKDKVVTDEGQLAYAEGAEPETVDMKKEHEEVWKHNQYLFALSDMIRGSQKFILPLEGDTGFDLGNYDGMKSLVRLPYRSIVLEYQTKKMFETDPEDMFGVNEQMTGKGLHGGCMILVVEDGAEWDSERESQRKWSMIPIAYNKAYGNWWCERIVYQLTVNEGGDFESFTNINYAFVDWEDKDSERTVKKINLATAGLDEVRENYLEHMGTICAEVFINFAIANNTKNIKETTIYPAKKLNAKRIANGKRPLFEYKILDIHREAIEFNRPMLSAGTGSKKRQHMCKGHFKKRKTGVYWWNPQVRGSKELGIVKKDYKLTA